MQLSTIALAATLAGLALAPIYEIPPILGLLLLLLAGLVSVAFRHNRRHLSCALFLLFLLLANLRYPLLIKSASIIDELDGAGIVEVVADVDTITQLDGGRCYLDLTVFSTLTQAGSLQQHDDLRIRLYLDEGTDSLFPGDRLRLKSRLRRPRLFGTPGEFDYPRHLAGEGLSLTSWLKSASQIELMAEGSFGLSRQMTVWRRDVGLVMQMLLPERQAQLTRALILGEGQQLEPELRKQLAAGGVSHLFAISGLHLGLIALFGYRLLYVLYVRFPALSAWQPPQRSLPFLLLPFLLAYLCFTGDATATRRAFLLALLVALFLARRYFVSPLTLLSSLAFLFLLVNPLLLWQAGWQLSFAGVAGILLWRPLWQADLVMHRQPLIRYPLQLLLVSAAATLATLPLVVMNFHQVAPAGVVANLVCVPLVSFVALPLGLFGVAAFPLAPSLAGYCWQGCGVLLEFLVELIGHLLSLPVCSGFPLFFSRWQTFALFLFLLPILTAPLCLRSKKFFIMVLFCGIGAGALWQLPFPGKEELSLTMFSVGQGESLLLRNCTGQAVLIDGGGLYSERFDVGERLLAPAFAELGVPKLDAIVLTHDHPDHRKGLVYLIDHFFVGQFYSGEPLNKLHPSLRDALLRNEIPVRAPGFGWSCLESWTQGELLIHRGMLETNEKNDLSLAVYLQTGKEDGLLLTGDLEREGIVELLRDPMPGPVSLLKLPHHGSRFSMIDELVNQLQPEICFVSVGYRNSYHLPASQVVNFLVQHKIPLYRTDFSGTLLARMTADGWVVKHWEGRLFR
ncbi:MAG: DNA internalization-related competence protein ComEC/Rec2 [Desulfuromonas sp.]|nr:MAG: DNA internalization-related competence protein ComEC/Rec2 [Desulfuromonas sp.]